MHQRKGMRKGIALSAPHRGTGTVNGRSPSPDFVSDFLNKKTVERGKVGEVFDCSSIGVGCMMIRVESFKTIERPTSGAMANSLPGDSEMTTGAITAADLTKIAEC